MRLNLLPRAFVVGVSLFVVLGLTSCKGGPDDATLTANVKAALARNPNLAQVTADSKAGVVTLAGAVKTGADKTAAETTAKAVEGVTSVANTVTVAAPVVVINPDQELKDAASATLKRLGITSVTIEVSNGEVTLNGDLPRAKLQDLMKAINESKPKKVLNKLTLK
jgi:hyperosmotically inducible periplasmic protein